MRVKKLNTNRRPKAGEDDAVLSSDSPSSPTNSPSQWTSPTKDTPSGGYSSPDSATATSSYRRAEVIDLGADSPTDPTTAPPLVLAHDVTELDLRHNHHHTTPLPNMPSTQPPPDTTTQPTAPSRSSSPTQWRDRVDRTLREGVHQKIVEYLKALKPNAPPKVLEKLPGLAYNMEEALLTVATSEQEYCDQSTLPQRLTLIQQANARRLLQQQCSAPGISPLSNKNARPGKPLNEEHARVVFSCLQSWRQKLVHMYGATPSDIVTNQILAKVAVFIPSSVQELVVCGVSSEQLDRFGSSLLLEIGKIMNALNANASANAAAQQLHLAMQQHAASRANSPPASANKRPSPSTMNPSVANGNGNNMNNQSTAAKNAANKKRKTGPELSANGGAVRLAAAPTPTYLPTNAFLTPSSASSLIRPMDAAFLSAVTSAAAAANANANATATATTLSSSLPSLLPSGPLPTTSSSAPSSSSSTSASSASNNGKLPFFPRIAVPGVSSSTPMERENNRMHLLAQGVGQLSRQQHGQELLLSAAAAASSAKTAEVYEKEIQALRWMLHESQREKAKLEAEVQRLRQQGAQ